MHLDNVEISIKMSLFDMEREGLEERHGFMSGHFFQNNGEFVSRELLKESSHEFDRDLIASKNGAKGVTFGSKVAKSVSFLNQGIIKGSFNTCLRRHDTEFGHVSQPNVFDFDRKGKVFRFRVHKEVALLFEFNLCW